MEKVQFYVNRNTRVIEPCPTESEKAAPFDLLKGVICENLGLGLQEGVVHGDFLGMLLNNLLPLIKRGMSIVINYLLGLDNFSS